jgi:hypothetical protein
MTKWQLIKQQIDKMTNLQNDKLLKRHADKMTKCQLDKMKISQNGNLTNSNITE